LQQEKAKIQANPTEKHIREKVNEILVENLKRRGGAPALNHQFPASTISNYVSEFASKGGVSLVQNSVDDTDACWTAKRSLIGSMSLLIGIALMHFYVVDVDDVAWRDMLKKLDEDERMMHEIVSQFHGGRPVRCQNPHLLLGVDDTTDYACEGIQPERSTEWGLVRYIVTQLGTNLCDQTSRQIKENGWDEDSASFHGKRRWR
jgi:hypothetical protein